MKTFVAILLLAGAFNMPQAWAQCAPGIPGAGNPECLPPDDINSPYYQGDRNQQSAQPKPARAVWADRWGAIATDYSNGNNSLGASTNLASRHQAEQMALIDCQAHGGRECKIEIWYNNECAAFVAGKIKHVTAAGSTIDEAVKNGVNICNGGDANCKAYYTGCSLPARVQ